MVDYAVTASSVAPGTNAVIRRGTAGAAAITAGQSVRLSAGTLVLAQADSSANVSGFLGVSLNDGAPGQPVNYIESGEYNSGATATAGDVAVISAAAAGGIAPVADLVSTNAVVVVGVFTTTTNIRLIDSGDAVVKG